MVPKGWEVRELHGLCKKISVGLAISVTPYMRDEGIKLIRNQNIKRNYFNDRSVVYIDPAFAESNKSKQVKLGDVVAVRTGSNIGEACVVPAEFDGALTFTTLIARPDPKLLDSFFLSTHINSELGVSEVNRLCAGGGKPNLNSGELKRYRLLVPPLPEQKKIAQILSTWDQAISTTEQLLANSQQQKKALMQQLLTGKKRLLDKNGVRFSGEWKSCTINKLLLISKGQQLNKDTLSNAEKYPVINGGVEPSGYTDKYNTEANTITISEGGNSCGYVSFQLSRFWCGGHCYAITNSKLDLYFTYQTLKFNQIKIMQLRVGSGLPNIQKKHLDAFPISFPVDVEEQQKIALVLTAADQEIATLQRKLDCLKQEKKALMQALLTGKRRVQL